MCGIFGWVTTGHSLSVENLTHAHLATMKLSHRGPDHQGEWQYKNIYMGHRRLSIIDLSVAAHQPFIHPVTGDVLIFNGEIYNYIELRDELKLLGHIFQTDSDTEVLLAALIQWDFQALTKIDGMFAGAWHQKSTNRHILFRDPLGQKPLYLARVTEGWIYSSELRSILSLPNQEWKLNRNNFIRFLFNSYYGGTDTPIEGVEKIAPGSIVEITQSNLKIHHYWNNRPGSALIHPQSDQEAIDQMEELLRQSCRRSMRSDVPYGVFLSGGLDSALIFDFCREYDQNVQSFNVAMSENDFDESSKARVVCRTLGAKQPQVFTMDQNHIQSSLAALLQASDEPHGDPGYVNSFFLTKSVKPFIKVGIAGDGGDELFAGYEPFSAAAPAWWFKKLPFLASIGRLLMPLLPETDSYAGVKFKANAFLQGFPAQSALRLPLWLGTMNPKNLANLCLHSQENFFNLTGESDSLLAPYLNLSKDCQESSEINHYLNFYQQIFLPEFVCMHMDRASMLNSLEVRAPFLSTDLIRFANSLPNQYKIRNGSKKWILRALAKRRGLPPMITSQRKQGFTFPIARWLKGPLKNQLDEMIWHSDWEKDNLVDQNYVSHLYDQHMNGRANNYRILFNLMVFRAWRNQYPNVKV